MLHGEQAATREGKEEVGKKTGRKKIKRESDVNLPGNHS